MIHGNDHVKRGSSLTQRAPIREGSQTQKSRLIESLLLNIPVPPVFFYESEAARYEVMDGQQRLNTINDFFSGAFALSGLKVLTPLNGLRYPKASPRVKWSFRLTFHEKNNC